MPLINSRVWWMRMLNTGPLSQGCSSSLPLFSCGTSKPGNKKNINPFYPEASADELQPVPDHFLKPICQH